MGMIQSTQEEKNEVTGFPYVDRGETLQYGGSQNWFHERWSRLAGCAAVSGTNLAAFYRIGVQPDRVEDGHPVYDGERYLALQQTMFGYMRPGFKGFPYIEKYDEKFREYAKDHGVSAEGEIFREWKDAETAFSCVRRSIDENTPLALLILTHNAPELDEDTWHWMTITGYEAYAGDDLAGEDGDVDKQESGSARSDRLGRVLISNYGNRQYLNASVLFDPAPGNDVKMIRFRIQR